MYYILNILYTFNIYIFNNILYTFNNIHFFTCIQSVQFCTLKSSVNVESTATFVIPRQTLIIALPCAQVEFTEIRDEMPSLKGLPTYVGPNVKSTWLRDMRFGISRSAGDPPSSFVRT